MVKIAVVAGSSSDQNIVNEAVKVLDLFKVDYETKILSAHRNRVELEEYVRKSHADVFIAIAGLSAHLPGAIASITTKPVVGVPVSVKLGGLDSLLSIVQMPTGVPVASVGIDAGKNGAYLALSMLSLKEKQLEERLIDNRRKLR